MNVKNLIIILILIFASSISFFLGNYHTLIPIISSAGLIFISVVAIWTAMRMRTKDLIILTASTLALATIDEYLHTSSGTYTYFDQGMPSPLAVFCWSLLMMTILTSATFITKLLPSERVKDERIRILPAVASIILLLIIAEIQGYLATINLPMALIYIAMGMAGLYYTCKNPLAWNASLTLSSLVIGGSMEFVGAWEGLWTFRFGEPVSLFIVFSWPLRTWAIHAICLFFNVGFANEGVRDSKSH